MGVTGVYVLLGALLVAAVLGVLVTRRNGRFTDAPGPAPESVEQSREDAEVLTAEDIGAPLGERVTLVQFSTAFCAPCRATRTLLADVTAGLDDVAYVDVDAESQLELVRRVGIMRTPTVLVLDARGAVTRRASGLPRREQVLAAIAERDTAS